jgi:alpha-N-arabinofuranosidase
VVKIGCLAQLVNVIAPIMTVKGGPAWRQSTYYPYLYASQYGRGTALNLAVQCQGYDTEFASDVSYLDISAVESDKDGALTFFIVNRHPDESIELDLSLQGFTHQKVIMDKVMSGHALDAKNGPDAEQVAPKDGQGASVTQQKLTASIAPMSYRMIRLGV